MDCLGQHQREQSQTHGDFVYDDFGDVDEEAGTLGGLVDGNEGAETVEDQIGLLLTHKVTGKTENHTHHYVAADKDSAPRENRDSVVGCHGSDDVCKADAVAVLFGCEFIDLTMHMVTVQFFKDHHGEAVNKADA